MYSRCISCRAPLGHNDVLELFPVGRRLAFDPHKGRLWVLCRSCRTWNLAPIEERWEAVEAAEKLFRDAMQGVSTENIALRRVSEGTELIRIGHAQLPEVASWRYKNRLIWRKRRYKLSLAALGTAASFMGGGTPAAIAAIGGWYGFEYWHDRRPVMRLDDGVILQRGEAGKAQLKPTAEAWQLILPRGENDLVLTGDEALRALRALLPRVNRGDWNSDDLRAATTELERAGSAERLIQLTSMDLAHKSNLEPPTRRGKPWGSDEPHRISAAFPKMSLALEMAVNEATERRALLGELALLEREWRDAEELASISDDLLVPRQLLRRLRAYRENKR